MKSASQRIEGLDSRLESEGKGMYPVTAIRLGLAVGLAIAQAIHEVAGEVSDVADAIREVQL